MLNLFLVVLEGRMVLFYLLHLLLIPGSWVVRCLSAANLWGGIRRSLALRSRQAGF
jgi:hypothetical protein